MSTSSNSNVTGLQRLELLAPSGFPDIQPGDALCPLIIQTLHENQLTLKSGDILVLAQKIVSKSENRYVRLDSVAVSAAAADYARACEKDPRLVELVLRESERVIRCVPGVLIVQHKLGFVHANAGIDRSNIQSADEQVLLLPENPDHSAARLRGEIIARAGIDVGILIVDSFGRAWRLGTCGVGIGSAGIEVLRDMRGKRDLYGRELKITEIALGDELAAAASCLMGAADESRPIVIARGLLLRGEATASGLIRPPDQDLFL